MTNRLKKQEYQVQVTVGEARNLRGKDSSGTSDPYVKVTVANLPAQVTTTAQATSSMAWNQSFTFTNVFFNSFILLILISFSLQKASLKVWNYFSKFLILMSFR